MVDPAGQNDVDIDIDAIVGRADRPGRIPHAREPRKLPVVLGAGEFVSFLEAVPDLKCRAALTTAYVAGLRVSEMTSLKVAEIDSSRMVIRVEQGKGAKDRYVMLSPHLLGMLRIFWRLARPAHCMFPGRDPEHPIHPAVLHAACRSARTAAGIDKRITVHTPRHSFATHLLESRTNTRMIQALLCHSNLQTTARYTQVATSTIRGNPSPIDRLRLEVMPPSGAAAMRPVLEVVDISRHHGDAFRQAHAHHFGPTERRVLAAIEACRTPALGGHVEQYSDCRLIRRAYNSCRHRHSPKCRGLAHADWLGARQAELLPVPYYHVVFTLPAPATEIEFRNKRGRMPRCTAPRPPFWATVHDPPRSLRSAIEADPADVSMHRLPGDNYGERSLTIIVALQSA